MQHRSPGDLQTGIRSCSKEKEESEEEESLIDYQKANRNNLVYLGDWKWWVKVASAGCFCIFNASPCQSRWSIELMLWVAVRNFTPS